VVEPPKSNSDPKQGIIPGSGAAVIAGIPGFT